MQVLEDQSTKITRVFFLTFLSKLYDLFAPLPLTVLSSRANASSIAYSQTSSLFEKARKNVLTKAVYPDCFSTQVKAIKKSYIVTENPVFVSNRPCGGKVSLLREWKLVANVVSGGRTMLSRSDQILNHLICLFCQEERLKGEGLWLKESSVFEFGGYLCLRRNRSWCWMEDKLSSQVVIRR